MQNKIFVICPTEIDYRELSRTPLVSAYDITFHAYDDNSFKRQAYQSPERDASFDPLLMEKELTQQIAELKPDGIISTLDYPGAVWAAILAQKFKLPGSSIEGVMAHQHKYYSRELQQQIVPDATPDFCAITNQDELPLAYPVFIKPIKSFLSFAAQKVLSSDGLAAALSAATLSASFLDQFNWFLTNYSNYAADSMVLAESLLTGEQCTLEGFLCNGQPTILGIVDSIMYPNTFSFKRFEYPSKLPHAVQERMGTIAKKLMMGSDFNHGFFNIECMYDAQHDRIAIIEVNPRMAYQFADLYEKVDGVNSYAYLLDLAVGAVPQVVHRAGLYQRAAIHVFREYHDRYVISCPFEEDIQTVATRFPEMRYQCFVTAGTNLSDSMQDGQTFRYATVSVGVDDGVDLDEQHDEILKMLDFKFD